MSKAVLIASAAVTAWPSGIKTSHDGAGRRQPSSWVPSLSPKGTARQKSSAAKRSRQTLCCRLPTKVGGCRDEREGSKSQMPQTQVLHKGPAESSSRAAPMPQTQVLRRSCRIIQSSRANGLLSRDTSHGAPSTEYPAMGLRPRNIQPWASVHGLPAMGLHPRNIQP
eukprot:366056-Chlamydomonas_euryale.AAC.9